MRLSFLLMALIFVSSFNTHASTVLISCKTNVTLIGGFGATAYIELVEDSSAYSVTRRLKNYPNQPHEVLIDNLLCKFDSIQKEILKCETKNGYYRFKTTLVTETSLDKSATPKATSSSRLNASYSYENSANLEDYLWDCLTHAP